MLGRLLERLTGRTLIELAQTEIFEPLELKQTFFNPEVAMQTGIAACETGNVYERETCGNSAAQDYKNWREELIWGTVHDGNAYFPRRGCGAMRDFPRPRQRHSCWLVNLSPVKLVCSSRRLASCFART